MGPVDEFATEVRDNIAGLRRDRDLQALSRIWVREAGRHRWAYNFTWLGRPAIQFPTDAWAMQEIIWAVRPDRIVETGVAHGGSLVFSASMLALLDYVDAVEKGHDLDPKAPTRMVVGVDIDIRQHNLEAIEAHPLAGRVALVEGSSTDPHTVARVQELVEGAERVLLCLDSNHTHDHVLAELRAYSRMVSVGSYLVVFDTLIEAMPEDSFPNRPWGPGNSPMSAVDAFLDETSDFIRDEDIPGKLLISVAPGGYLRRVR